MRPTHFLLLALIPFLCLCSNILAAPPIDPPASRPDTQPSDDFWIEPMRQVHAKFTGQKGTLAHFGDSITFSMAFWAPLQWSRQNASPEMEQAFQRVNKYIPKECWGAWKGAKYGNEGGQTIIWAAKHIDQWLIDVHPETATLMFGTNDVNGVSPKDYEAALRQVIHKCLDKGAIVILFTIPPKHGADEKVKELVAIQRRVAAEMKLPLIDYYAQIMQRRPDDWDGASDKFKDFTDYQAPTLISRDGVHPTTPRKYDNYSEDALNNNGYALRTYLTLMKYDQVLQKVLLPPAQP